MPQAGYYGDGDYGMVWHNGKKQDVLVIVCVDVLS
jgi:hypothetical protein